MRNLSLNAIRLSAALAIFAPTLLAQNLTVRSVSVLSVAGQPQIEVKTSGPVSPATQAVVGPDRIVIDFPGALPASTLKKLAVHRGGLERIRTGLFQSQPPITRIVLDVDGPTDYQVVPSGNSIVIKLGRPELAGKPEPMPAALIPPAKIAMAPPTRAAVALRTVRQPASSIPALHIPPLQIVNSVSATPRLANTVPAPPPHPAVNVGVNSNLLSIRAQGATLAEVLYEVHRRTGADIAIPAGAEQERVVVNIPSAPGRDVIASLLNGSRFNYIVLGTDSDPGGFRNLLLSLKQGGGSSGVFVHTAPPPPAAPQPDPAAEQPQPPDPSLLAQPAPEIEPIPEDTSANEAEPNPDAQHPQQAPVMNVPEAGQGPQ